MCCALSSSCCSTNIHNMFYAEPCSTIGALCHCLLQMLRSTGPHGGRWYNNDKCRCGYSNKSKISAAVSLQKISANGERSQHSPWRSQRRLLLHFAGDQPVGPEPHFVGAFQSALCAVALKSRNFNLHRVPPGARASTDN